MRCTSLPKPKGRAVQIIAQMFQAVKEKEHTSVKAAEDLDNRARSGYNVCDLSEEQGSRSLLAVKPKGGRAYEGTDRRGAPG
jgi:hypothetical protein